MCSSRQVIIIIIQIIQDGEVSDNCRVFLTYCFVCRYHNSDPIRYSQYPRIQSRFLRRWYKEDEWLRYLFREAFMFVLCHLSQNICLQSMKNIYNKVEKNISFLFVRLKINNSILDDSLSRAGSFRHDLVNVWTVLLIVGDHNCPEQHHAPIVLYWRHAPQQKHDFYCKNKIHLYKLWRHVLHRF